MDFLNMINTTTVVNDGMLRFSYSSTLWSTPAVHFFKMETGRKWSQTDRSQHGMRRNCGTQSHAEARGIGVYQRLAPQLTS